MDIIFDKENHLYLDSTRTVSFPSISHILMMLLGNSYAGVKPEVLKRAAERGIIVHEDIDHYEKTGELGITEHIRHYVELKKKHGFSIIEQEKIVYASTPYGPFAGTYDLLMNFLNDPEPCIGDIKTVINLDIFRTTLQMSLYRYAARIKSLKGYIIWLRPDKGELIPVTLLNDAECEELIRKFYAGEKLSREKDITLEKVKADDFVVLKNALEIIKHNEEVVEGIRAKLLEEMGSRGIEKLTFKGVKVNYIPPTNRFTFDTTKFKKENPEIAAKYNKQTEIKASVRVVLDEPEEKEELK